MYSFKSKEDISRVAHATRKVEGEYSALKGGGNNRRTYGGKAKGSVYESFFKVIVRPDAVHNKVEIEIGYGIFVLGKLTEHIANDSLFFDIKKNEEDEESKDFQGGYISLSLTYTEGSFDIKYNLQDEERPQTDTEYCRIIAHVTSNFKVTQHQFGVIHIEGRLS